MHSGPKAAKIRKSDYARVIVTETAPFETPIVFSNDGLYRIAADKGQRGRVEEALFERLVKTTGLKPKRTIPFRYKIRKGTKEFRQLFLLHPSIQWRFKEFYEKYENLLLHFCIRSPLSIRAPEKVANTYYVDRQWEAVDRYKFKDGVVVEEGLDKLSRYSPSFFAYKGYDRLYKFFDSDEFFGIEKTFSTMWSLDVSKCFGSIYTHSLSWALKDKLFTKNHVDITSTFAQAFDHNMRLANHDETHGIPIGPEVSRIFAEMIFQSVDMSTLDHLRGHGLNAGTHFDIRRYVDDVFIFANDQVTGERVQQAYADKLLDFGLHFNTAKMDMLSRPFMTQKSRIIRDAGEAADSFVDSFLEKKDESGKLVPIPIRSWWGLTRTFMQKIKSICSENKVGYDTLSSYLISVLTRRVKKMVDIEGKVPNDNRTEYRDASIVLLEALYFLYSVAPSVSASYKFATSLIIVVRFFNKHIPEYEDTVKQRIYDLTESLLVSSRFEDGKDISEFVSLESVNVVLACKEMGPNYLLPPETIEVLFFRDRKLSYFGIVSCLFYIGSEPMYQGVFKKLLSALQKRFKSLTNVAEDAELAALCVDAICCPYINQKTRKAWLKRLYQSLQLQQPTAADTSIFFQNVGQRNWFVNWSEADLLNCLQRKELKRAY